MSLRKIHRNSIHCCVGFSVVGESRGYFLVVVHRLLTVVASLVAEHGPLGWTAGSPWSPRDSQKSSPTPQFKSINSLALSFLYSATLTSKEDPLEEAMTTHSS